MVLLLDGWKRRSRRVGCLNVDAGNFLEIIRSLDGTRVVVCKGIPEDAKLLAVTLDATLHFVKLYIESATFEEVALGYLIPEIQVICHQQPYSLPQPRQSSESTNVDGESG